MKVPPPSALQSLKTLFRIVISEMRPDSYQYSARSMPTSAAQQRSMRLPSTRYFPRPERRMLGWSWKWLPRIATSGFSVAFSTSAPAGIRARSSATSSVQT